MPIGIADPDVHNMGTHSMLMALTAITKEQVNWGLRFTSPRLRPIGMADADMISRRS